jgi:filamentous hemagglutinin
MVAPVAIAFHGAIVATGNAKLNAGRNLTATIGGAFSNNSSTVSAGGNIAITAGYFGNNAASNTYHGNVFAGGGGHDLWAYGYSAAVVQAAGSVSINAGSSSNTGTVQGAKVYVGGSLVNGLTSYHQPTPASTLPHAVIDLSGSPTDANGVPLPAVPTAPDAANLPSAPIAPGAAGLSLIHI